MKPLPEGRDPHYPKANRGPWAGGAGGEEVGLYPAGTPHKPRVALTGTAHDFRAAQQQFAAVIMRPLSRHYRTQRTWLTGAATARFIAPLVKPNDRLTAPERIEIYNRQYWFRLLDNLYDDFPGLLAVLGWPRFRRLGEAYLDACPSRSFSLRNLGQELPQFIALHAELVTPDVALATDLARFEWAQIEAFDGPARPLIDAHTLAATSPQRLRLGLQPYLQLLDLRYPLDDYVLALKKRDAALRGATSNAIEHLPQNSAPARTPRRPSRPRPEHTLLAVHRFDNVLYYKRLHPAAYTLLQALRGASKPGGSKLATVQEACTQALKAAPPTPTDNWPQHVPAWFALWSRLGWFCQYVPHEKGR